MKAKLTVLGSGTSMGVPTIGCDCAVCHSSDPRDRRTRPSVLIEYGGRRVIIDTTPDFREQAIRENIRSLDAPADLGGVMSDEVALCLYRVGQETLRNVAKHSAGKSAWVRLWKKEGRIYLSIRDDGIGFDPASPANTGGIGLVSMKERIRLVDGEFTLKTARGQGTRINAWAPIPKDNS
jgi:signal transduction histidine kinase